MKTSFLSIIMLLIFVAIMVIPASAEEVAIDFDGDGLAVGQSIGDAYADYGVTFVGAKVVDTNEIPFITDLGFVPNGETCALQFSPYVTSVSIEFENALTGTMDGFLVNGEKITDTERTKITYLWYGNTLHIEGSTQNPIKSVQLSGYNVAPCINKIQFDNLRYIQTQIPEFPTVALPVAALIGMIFIFQRRKD